MYVASQEVALKDHRVNFTFMVRYSVNLTFMVQNPHGLSYRHHHLNQTAPPNLGSKWGINVCSKWL